jgi:hypothetical protein
MEPAHGDLSVRYCSYSLSCGIITNQLFIGTPDGQEYSKHVMSPETPAVYEEDIGLRGSIAKLPGINSVYVKP